jgi:hypothetical protein
MLNIQRSLNGDTVAIGLVGRVLDHDLPQLEALIESERQGLVLNLAQVTIIGGEAVRFLARCQEVGLRLEDTNFRLHDPPGRR